MEQINFNELPEVIHQLFEMVERIEKIVVVLKPKGDKVPSRGKLTIRIPNIGTPHPEFLKKYQIQFY